uniref:Uncharacterized protein n=1 Tax=Oryza sativa subsp. japonica TaxID=39947 RepID=Q69K95_ORYSJ|nr:hypothetical protein [Oryza sativa Japonica Group]
MLADLGGKEGGEPPPLGGKPCRGGKLPPPPPSAPPPLPPPDLGGGRGATTSFTLRAATADSRCRLHPSRCHRPLATAWERRKGKVLRERWEGRAREALT